MEHRRLLQKRETFINIAKLLKDNLMVKAKSLVCVRLKKQ